MDGDYTRGSEHSLSSLLLSEIGTENDGNPSCSRQPVADLEKLISHVRKLRPSPPLPRELSDVRQLARLFGDGSRSSTRTSSNTSTATSSSSSSSSRENSDPAQQTTEVADLEELLHMATLLNDVDTRYLLLTPNLYASVAHWLTHYLIDDGGGGDGAAAALPVHACILALLPTLVHSAHLVLGRETAAVFLRDDRLQCYLLHVLEQFGSSPLVLERAHWLPYFAQMLQESVDGDNDVAGDYWRELRVGAEVSAVDVKISALLCQLLGAGSGMNQRPVQSRPFLQNIARLLVHWLVAFRAHRAALCAVLHALRATVVACAGPTDGLLGLLPRAELLLQLHRGDVEVVRLVLGLFIAADAELVSALCHRAADAATLEQLAELVRAQCPWPSASTPVDAADAAQQKAQQLAAREDAFRVLLRVCAAPSCAALVSRRPELLATVLDGLRRRLADAQMAEDGAPVLRLLYVLCGGLDATTRCCLVARDLLRRHGGRVAVLRPLAAAMFMLCVSSAPPRVSPVLHREGPVPLRTLAAVDEIRAQLADDVADGSDGTPPAVVLAESTVVAMLLDAGLVELMLAGYVQCVASSSPPPSPGALWALSSDVLHVLSTVAMHADASTKERLVRGDVLRPAACMLLRRFSYSGQDMGSLAYQQQGTVFRLVNCSLLCQPELVAVAYQSGWLPALMDVAGFGDDDSDDVDQGDGEEIECVDLDDSHGRAGGGSGRCGRQAPASNTVVELCLDCMLRMSSGKDAALRQALLQLGLHRFYIAQLLRRRSPSLGVVHRACQALCVLMGSTEAKAQLIDAGAAEGLSAVLLAHPGQQHVNRIALLCVASLSLTDREHRDRLIAAGLHAAVHGVLRRSDFPPLLHTLAVVVLLRLVMDDGDVNDVVHLPGLQCTVLRVLQDRSPASRLEQTATDLFQCSHSLLANVFSSSVWAAVRVAPLYRGRGFHCLQSNVYQDALLKYTGLTTRGRHQDGVVTEATPPPVPYPRHPCPLVSTRLAGMALHTCPNCRNGLASEAILACPSLAAADYERLTERGWFRRGGLQLFQYRSNHAAACNTAEIRVRVQEFDPCASRAYARVRRKVERAGVEVRVVKPSFEPSAYELYLRYQVGRHESEFCCEQTYRSHLLQTPLRHEPSACGLYEYGTFHYQYWVGDHLAGVSVVDVLPHSMGSIYMFFDVDKQYSRLSLGVFSCLKELEFAQEMNRRGADIRYYYLGNYCPASRKLAYKADYRPTEVLCPHVSMEWSAHSRDQPSYLFETDGLPPNPLPELYLRDAIEQGTAEVQWRTQEQQRTSMTAALPVVADVEGSADRVYSLPSAKQRLVANVSSPYLRFVAAHPDRTRCADAILRLRVCVDGEEMSFGDMLLRYFVHPHCVGRLCWTLEELLAGFGHELFERLIVHFQYVPDTLWVEPCSPALV